MASLIAALLSIGPLSPCMLYWWHCWVNLDVILSLERAKSIKTVRIKFKKVLNTADLD